MSKLRNMFIYLDNLTDKEQMDLWITLNDFANTTLPDDKILLIGVIKNERRNRKYRKSVG